MLSRIRLVACTMLTLWAPAASIGRSGDASSSAFSLFLAEIIAVVHSVKKSPSRPFDGAIAPISEEGSVAKKTLPFLSDAGGLCAVFFGNDGRQCNSNQAEAYRQSQTQNTFCHCLNPSELEFVNQSKVAAW